MLEGFQNINKAFESKVRLGVMAVLMVNDEADFNMLKELLSLTDGNLASHTERQKLLSGRHLKGEQLLKSISRHWRAC